MLGVFMAKVLLIFITIIASPSFALVDYSPKGSSNKSIRKSVSVKRVATKSKKSLGLGFSFGLETVNVVEENRSKIDLYQLSTVMNIPMGLNFSASAMFGDVRSGTDGMSMVNSRVELGVNWINFGKSKNRMTVDFLTGAEFSSTENGLGHQRNDYYFGVLSHKELGEALIGLGANFWMMGKSERPQDQLDSLKKVHFSLGFNATSDIRFDFLLNYLSFKNMGVDSRSFSYLEFNPNLSLMLSRSFALQLGGKWSGSEERFSISNFSMSSFVSTR